MTKDRTIVRKTNSITCGRIPMDTLLIIQGTGKEIEV